MTTNAFRRRDCPIDARVGPMVLREHGRNLIIGCVHHKQTLTVEYADLPGLIEALQVSVYEDSPPLTQSTIKVVAAALLNGVDLVEKLRLERDALKAENERLREHIANMKAGIREAIKWEP